MFSTNKTSFRLGVRKVGGKVLPVLALLALTALATGCTQQIKDAFYLQSGVSGKIGYAAEEAEENGDAKRLRVLYKAEDELDEACEEIKEIGTLTFWKKVISAGLALLAFDSIDRCESKAHEINGKYFSKLPSGQ